MRKIILLGFVLAVLVFQTSCGLISQQANYAKSILQWPFRAELDARHLDGIGDLDREAVLPQQS